MGRIATAIQVMEDLVIFVPAHAGIKGNERADLLASTVTVTEGKYMARAVTLSACEIQCVLRMQEMQIKIVGGKQGKKTRHTLNKR